MKIYLKIKYLFSRYGLKFVISKFIIFIISKLNFLNEIEIVKTKLNYDIAELFQNKVKYGIFKEMTLSKKTWWGKYDVATKLLGQYELQVTNKIIECSKNYDIFIDIGAADGYYAVGCIFSNLFSESICFEISEKGRKIIEENSILNGVYDRIKIFGIANTNSIKNVLTSDTEALILIDIEGDEFDLLSDDFLFFCKKSTLIIELHDKFVNTGVNNRDDLFNRANKYFEISYLERVNPDIYSFNELDYLNDNYRQLVFSEGRPIKMEWVCFTPKINKS